MVPFSMLTDEQVMALMDAHPKMMRVPGVVLVLVDFIGPGKTDVAVVATVYSGNHHDLSQLPVSIAGLPVVVEVEDRHTGLVVEVIDPRQNEGEWPRTNHRN